jgi:hypothetical protein
MTINQNTSSNHVLENTAGESDTTTGAKKIAKHQRRQEHGNGFFQEDEILEDSGEGQNPSCER